MTRSALPAFLPLTPRYHARVWGGTLLAPPAEGGTPIGEAWLADGESVVASGPAQGRTVDELLREHGAALLGEGQETAGGFPLLLKLLDCGDWLSVQVHPNDEQARRLVGPGARGKTEAWHFLQTAPNAEIIAGVRDGVGAEELADAIHAGQVLPLARRHRVGAGDTAFIPAGTLHALGPGTFLLEIQQASDTTYRVYDWDRPAEAGRKLHLKEAAEVTDPASCGDLRRAEGGGGEQELVRCPFFVLRRVEGGSVLDLGGTSAQLVTAAAGELTLVGAEGRTPLPPHRAVLVPAATRSCRLEGEGWALVASLPRPQELGRP